jgi:hypothetical protein
MIREVTSVNCSKLRIAGSVALIGLLAAIAQPTNAAEFLNFGGSFQVIGTNAPNNFSETDTLALGTVPIDSGALALTVSTVAAASGGEWAIFDFQTPPGTTIAGDLNANWEMHVNNVPIVQPAIFAHSYLDWGTDGTLFSPTSDLGANRPLETNPVTGSGLVFGGPEATPVTTVVDVFGFADTFNGFLTGTGFTPSEVNEFQIGFLLDPVPTSEPTSGLLLLSGLVMTILAIRWRRVV